MKRFIIVISIIFSIVLINGCAANKNSNSSSQSTTSGDSNSNNQSTSSGDSSSNNESTTSGANSSNDNSSTNNSGTKTTLTVKEKSALAQTVKFYYPTANDNKLNFVSKQVTYEASDTIKSIMEKGFKTLPNKDLGVVLSPNAKIKSLYLNKDNMVYVDFTKEFVSEMNAGSGYESMILQSITNTLGTFYGVDKVYITVEGEPYASGHIIMKKGEFFTVDLKNSVEIK